MSNLAKLLVQHANLKWLALLFMGVGLVLLINLKTDGWNRETLAASGIPGGRYLSSGTVGEWCHAGFLRYRLRFELSDDAMGIERTALSYGRFLNTYEMQPPMAPDVSDGGSEIHDPPAPIIDNTFAVELTTTQDVEVAISGQFDDTEVGKIITGQIVGLASKPIVFQTNSGLSPDVIELPDTGHGTINGKTVTCGTLGDSQPGLMGDVNCDGVVNPVDAALLLQLAAGLISTLPCPAVSDVNVDGTKNPIDAALVLQFSAGLISALPA